MQSEANDEAEAEAESSEEEADDGPSRAGTPKGKRRLVGRSQLTQYACAWSCTAIRNNNFQTRQTQDLDDDGDEQPSRSMDWDGEEDDKPPLSAKAKGKQRAR